MSGHKYGMVPLISRRLGLEGLGFWTGDESSVLRK